MVAGSGLPKNWWTRQEKVGVNFAGQQGFLLNRYMLYELVTEVCYTNYLVYYRHLISDIWNSEVHRLQGGTPSSCSSGIAWCDGTLFVYYPSFRLSA